MIAIGGFDTIEEKKIIVPMPSRSLLQLTDKTFPMLTVSTDSGERPADASAALAATVWSSVAPVFSRDPP